MTKKQEDPLHYARDIVGKDPMATYLGIKVEEVRKEYARCSLVIKPQYLNALDRAHGISVYAVADQAFAVACCSGGYKGIALSFTINFTRGAEAGEKII